MALSNPHVFENLSYPKLRNFDVSNLHLESHALKNNPLGDSVFRNNPVLSPKSPSKVKLGLIFVLAGFAGNGTKYLGDKGFEETFIQQIDRLVSHNKAPLAHYVFVDAWTFWGGSQFVNSKGTGRYEDFIIKELYPILSQNLDIAPDHVAIMGQSSGGYGALHLASAHPHLFPFCGALAPDCFFEASLLPDLYKAAPFLLKNKRYADLKAQHRDGKILKQRNGFSILNAIAMNACYSRLSQAQKLEWPLNLETGLVNTTIWKQWLQHDPVVFLKKRKKKLEQLHGLFLDVGGNDEFNLQLGVRQIHQYLKANKIRHHYSEHDGGHFDAQERYPLFWTWLKEQWKT